MGLFSRAKHDETPRAKKAAETTEQVVRAAVVDAETTGLYKSDRIIELAVVIVNLSNGETLAEYDTLINPGRDVGPTRIHGITASMVAQAPTFADIADELARLLDGTLFVAHNLAFDTRMVTAEFTRLNIDFDPGVGICTLKRTGTNLADACAHYDIELDGAHQAINDARATSRLLVASIFEEAGGPDGALTILANPIRVNASKLGTPATTPRLTRADVPAQPTVTSMQRHNAIGLTSDDPELMPYLDLLGRAVEDLVLTDDEMAELTEMATASGLDSSQITAAHRLAIATLNSNLPPSAANRALLVDLAARMEVPAPKPTAAQMARAELRAVCFTGDISIDGEFVTHDQLADMARAGGYEIVERVTKKFCSLLVAGDVLSQSTKAKKANEYGVEIVDGDGFAALLADES